MPGLRSTPRARRGTTLLELIVVLAILGVLAGVAVPGMRAAAARRATRAAARDLALLLSAARQIAATSAGGAAVGFDTVASTARLVAGGDTLRLLDLGSVHRVTLAASRDSVAYDSRGLGHGAANVTLVLTQGGAADTIVVSRLGRLRGGW